MGGGGGESRSRPVVRLTLGSLVLHCPLHMLVKSGNRCHLGMKNKCSDKINRCSRLYQLWLIDCHQLMTGLLQSNAISEGQWDYFVHLVIGYSRVSFPSKKFMNQFGYNLQVYYGTLGSLSDSILHVRRSLKSFVILRWIWAWMKACAANTSTQLF